MSDQQQSYSLLDDFAEDIGFMPNAASQQAAAAPPERPGKRSAEPGAEAKVCYYHPDRAGSAKCSRCGKHLCSSCASRSSKADPGDGVILCGDCLDGWYTENIRRQRQNSKAQLVPVIYLGISFVVLLLFGGFLSKRLNTFVPMLLLLLFPILGAPLDASAIISKRVFEASSTPGKILGFFIGFFSAVVAGIKKLISCVRELLRLRSVIKSLENERSQMRLHSPDD